jgi:hypothetical protein
LFDLQVKDVKGCDAHICRFTADGRYLVGFTKHLKDIVVYLFKGLQYSCPAPGEQKQSSQSDEEALPAAAQHFSRCFEFEKIRMADVGNPLYA